MLSRNCWMREEYVWALHNPSYAHPDDEIDENSDKSNILLLLLRHFKRLFSFNPHNCLCNKYFSYPHFIEGETKIKKKLSIVSNVTWLGKNEPEKPMFSDSRVLVLSNHSSVHDGRGRRVVVQAYLCESQHTLCQVLESRCWSSALKPQPTLN